MDVAKFGSIESDLVCLKNCQKKVVIFVTLRINMGRCIPSKLHPLEAQNLNGHAMVNLLCHDRPTRQLSFEGWLVWTVNFD